MPRVTILPFQVTIDCADGESVFAAARRQGVLIPTACAGKATCGLCRVKLVGGEGNVPPIKPEETRHLGNTYFITKLRLACQMVPTGDVTVQLPDAKPKGAVKR
jgi:ferredoxin